jgi:hypothetical protein
LTRRSKAFDNEGRGRMIGDKKTATRISDQGRAMRSTPLQTNTEGE